MAEWRLLGGSGGYYGVGVGVGLSGGGGYYGNPYGNGYGGNYGYYQPRRPMRAAAHLVNPVFSGLPIEITNPATIA